MAKTGKLGGNLAYLGNFLLGAPDGAEDTGNELEREVEQSLALVQEAICANLRNELSQTLTFLQTASYIKHKPRTVSQSLNLTDEAECGGSRTSQVEQELELEQTVLVQREFQTEIEQTLSFTQTAHSNIQHFEIVQELELEESVDSDGPISETVDQLLELTQSATCRVAVRHLEIEQELNLVSKVNRHRHLTVSQSLNLSQSGRRWLGAKQTLNLVQTVQVSRRGRQISQQLGLTQEVGINTVLGRELPQTLNLLQSVAYVIDRGCTELNYSPFVGVGAGGAPPTTQPTLSDSTFTLTYPYVTPTTTLVLRNPRFGNRHEMAFNRIARETRGGTLNVYADPSWPKTETLRVELTLHNCDPVDDVLDFLRDSLGQRVGLLDHEGRQWHGVILNPDTAISQIERSSWSVNLEFQGALA